MKVNVNTINTWCILMSEAVSMPSLMMMTLIVSEELLARDARTHAACAYARTHTHTHTHTDARTDAHTHVHSRTHTHTHRYTHTHTHTGSLYYRLKLKLFKVKSMDVM